MQVRRLEKPALSEWNTNWLAGSIGLPTGIALLSFAWHSPQNLAVRASWASWLRMVDSDPENLWQGMNMVPEEVSSVLVFKALLDPCSFLLLQTDRHRYPS